MLSNPGWFFASYRPIISNCLVANLVNKESLGVDLIRHFQWSNFFRASIGLLYKKKTQKEVYKVDIRPVNHRPNRTTGSKKLIYMIGNRGGLWRLILSAITKLSSLTLTIRLSCWGLTKDSSLKIEGGLNKVPKTKATHCWYHHTIQIRLKEQGCLIWENSRKVQDLIIIRNSLFCSPQSF